VWRLYAELLLSPEVPQSLAAVIFGSLVAFCELERRAQPELACQVHKPHSGSVEHVTPWTRLVVTKAASFITRACFAPRRCLCRRRTAYAKVQARLQFPDDYPTTSASPIVELTSASLPQPFLRKLTKSAEEAARVCPVTADTDDSRSSSGGGAGGKGKAVAALKVVVDVVNKNKFVPCWKELRQSANLVTSR